jgi:hypothetical protein
MERRSHVSDLAEAALLRRRDDEEQIPPGYQRGPKSRCGDAGEDVDGEGGRNDTVLQDADEDGDEF